MHDSLVNESIRLSIRYAESKISMLTNVRQRYANQDQAPPIESSILESTAATSSCFEYIAFIIKTQRNYV